MSIRPVKDCGSADDAGQNRFVTFGMLLKNNLSTTTSSRTGSSSKPARRGGERTWHDVGFGATYTTRKDSFLYVDVERSLGGGLKPTWEVNPGINYRYH